MENDTQQPNTLDPTIKNLSMAIRQQESGGNFKDVGDKGTSSGAYQWQPETWSAESKQYLGTNAPNSPLDATPEEQNEVAYKTLADWKKQGLTQAQSASKWNSGNPNAYLENNVGTNSKLGVNYNTPQYVKNVEQNYGALKNGQPFTTSKGGATDTSAHTSGMPTWEKIALGIPLVAGATALAVGSGGLAVPEEVAGAESIGAIADAGEITGGAGSGILSEAGNAVKGFITNPVSSLLKTTGIAGLGETAVNSIKGIFGGNKTTDTSGEEAATENAGQTEANATNQASEAQINEEELTNDQNEANTQNQLEQEKNTKNALNNTLSSTPANKVLAQQPWVQDAIATSARNGYVPDTSTGYNDVSDATEKADKDLGTLSNGVAEVLDAEGGSANIEEVRQNAYANIKKYVPIPEQEQATALVDKQLEAYQKAYGDNFTLGNIERAKREQGMAKGDWQKDAPTKNGHKSLYHAMRDTITKHTKHKDLYNRTMKEEQKIYDAKKILKKISGKKAFEHKGILRGVLKSYGKYVGTYLGDKIGGPLGAIVGTMVGDHLTKAVDKRFGKTYFESKEGKKLIELASKKSPEMAKVLKNELKKYGVKAEEIKKEMDIMKKHQEWQKETGKAPISMGGKSEESKKSEETRINKKREEYKEKKKGLLNHDIHTKNPYMNLEDFSKLGKDIQFGRPTTPKKKKKEKGLLTIKA